MINSKFFDFGCDARNLRLSLFPNRMHPHSNMSSTHITWPVVLIIYNLPIWLCMKCEFIRLSLLISGFRQPENNIDVYLAPLIEDLKTMWEEGVEVFDAYHQQNFKLKAILLWTINSFPVHERTLGMS